MLRPRPRMTIRTSDVPCRSPVDLQNERPFGLSDAPARIGTCTLQPSETPEGLSRRPRVTASDEREDRRTPFTDEDPSQDRATRTRPHAPLRGGTRRVRQPARWALDETQATETAWTSPCHRPFHPEDETRASATLETRARPPYTQPATFFEAQDSGASSVRDGSSTSAVTTTYGHSPLEHRSLRGRRPQPSSGTHSDVSGSVSQARFV